MRALSGTLLLSLLLAACGGPSNTRYYSFPGVRDVDMARVGRMDKVIVVGPITINESIDRPQLMIRRSDAQIEIRENDLWANSLEKEIQQLTIAGLGKLLGSDKVFPFPWTDGKGASYRVSPEVVEMSAMPGSEAILTIAWSIYNEKSDKQLTLPTTHYRAPVSAGADLNAMVIIYQELLLRATRDLARRLINPAKTPVTKSPAG